MTHRFAIILAGALLAAGCVQEPAKPTGGKVVRAGNSGQDSGVIELPPGATPPNAVEATDPVASQLHDVSGLLLEYYLLNKRLPPKLDDLRPLADPGQSTDFSDPKTKQQFVYLPIATRMSPGDTRLVLYAPTPNDRGQYQGVLMRMSRGTQVTATWVVTLSAIELQGYTGSLTSTSRPVQ